MKRLFSSGITSAFTFILSVLAILVVAVSAPGMVQAMLGPASSGDVQPGSPIQASGDKVPVVNPAAQIGTLADTGIFGTVGIGITSPVSPLHIYSTTSTQPETIDLDGAQPITAQWNDYSNTGGAFSGSGFLARFARGTRASPANVQAGDRLGFTVFGGWAGGAFRHTAAIEGLVDNLPVSDTSLPTFMRFSTTDNGTTTRAERMRIDPAGRVGINTTSPYGGAKLMVVNDNASGGMMAMAIYGSGTGCNGVYGKSDTLFGVQGESPGGIGVLGRGTYGVQGLASLYYGVYGGGPNGNYGTLGDNRSGVYGNGSPAGRFDGPVVINTTSPSSGAKLTVVNDNATGGSNAIYGTSNAPGTVGVSGSGPTGVSGASTVGTGVYGSSVNGWGVFGNGTGSGSAGVYGACSPGGLAGRFDGPVVVNTTSPYSGAKLTAVNDNATAGSNAIYGVSDAGGTTGVYGASFFGTGVYGSSNNGTAVYGNGNGSYTTGVYGIGNSYGVHGESATGYAGYFTGKVYVAGTENVTGDLNVTGRVGIGTTNTPASLSFPDAASIGPASDSAATLYFRTKNISGGSPLYHRFMPTDSDYGYVGLNTNYWKGMYAEYYYGKNTSVQSFDIYDDLATAAAIKVKTCTMAGSDTQAAKEVAVFDTATMPREIMDASGEFVDISALNGFLLGCVRQAQHKIESQAAQIKAQEAKIQAQEARLEALLGRIEVLESKMK